MLTTSETSLWLAIWLPRLSTDRLRCASTAPDKNAALVCYGRVRGAFVLTGADAAASALGLQAGMALADARAMQPAMIAVEADEDADRNTLDGVAAWCERYGPCVVVDEPNGLFVEIGGSAHLFGGAAALMRDAQRRLTNLGFEVKVAVAATPGAAWALARWKSGAVAGMADLAGALGDLPVSALRLEPEAARFLKRAGLNAIGQIAAAPRSVFAARAGEKALGRLDQALGRASEALSPRREPPPILAQRRLLEPIFQTEAVLTVAEALIADVLVQLEQRDAGIKEARLILFAVDGHDRVFKIGASRPERDPRAILRLFREQLNRLGEGAPDEDLGGEFGFEAARLDVTAFQRIERRLKELSGDFAAEDAAAGMQMTALIDVLSARLGADRVMRPCLAAAHQPERQGKWEAALRASAEKDALAAGPSADNVLRRPLTLFRKPQPIEALAVAPEGQPIRFRWRRVARRISRANGPERITPDWLKAGEDRTRDYYRVEDETGQRYWLFREGAYGAQSPPRWFIHGLFP